MKVRDWLDKCNKTQIYLEIWDTDDRIDTPYFVGYSSELQNSSKYRRILNYNLDLWDFDHTNADYSESCYFQLIVSGVRKESYKRKLRINEVESAYR